ncbi:MAG TPA: septation protein SepH [Terrabacter sp.]|nr:septation protein SepH [Terrabacter sp.]
MQHLRLVGVHEDGLHLLLADDQGNRYSLPLDEALRAAARRDRPRLGQLQIETNGGLRPKDVQAMIRAGMTAEDVAERAGWSVEKVHRYEGPILAEREHVAGLARQVRLRPRGGSHGGAPTLEARVTERLRAREIDAGSAQWDSRRTDKGAWTIVLLFNAGGRRREALWQFDPLARTVSAVDDEARWLSEDEDQQAPGPIPAPHLSASTRPSRVYDVEAEGGVAASATRRRQGETVDLMAAIRERSSQRGRRRRPKSAEVPGLDEAPEEALPLEELARDHREQLPPPAHTHPEDDPGVTKTGTVEARVGAEAARRKARRTEPTQPVRQAPKPSSGKATPEPTPEVTTESMPESMPEAADEIADDTHSRPAEDALQGQGSDAVEAVEASGPTGGTEPTDTAIDDSAIDDSAIDDTIDEAAVGATDEATDEAIDEAVDQATDDGPALRPAGRRREGSRPLSGLPDEHGQGSSPGRRDEGSKGRRGDHADGDGEGYDVVEQRPSAAAPKPAPRPTPRPAPPARKSGRPSVPSWDDIMFGRKND